MLPLGDYSQHIIKVIDIKHVHNVTPKKIIYYNLILDKTQYFFQCYIKNEVKVMYSNVLDNCYSNFDTDKNQFHVFTWVVGHHRVNNDVKKD